MRARRAGATRPARSAGPFAPSEQGPDAGDPPQARDMLRHVGGMLDEAMKALKEQQRRAGEDAGEEVPLEALDGLRSSLRGLGSGPGPGGGGGPGGLPPGLPEHLQRALQGLSRSMTSGGPGAGPGAPPQVPPHVQRMIDSMRQRAAASSSGGGSPASAPPGMPPGLSQILTSMGAGAPGSPANPRAALSALKRVFDGLEAAGMPVGDLRTRVDAVLPDLERMMDLQARIQRETAAGGAPPEDAVRELEELNRALRPRLQGMVSELQEGLMQNLPAGGGVGGPAR